MKVLYVGSVGFPVGFMAASQKQRLIAKALAEGGCDVTVVSRKSVGIKSELPYKGTFEGIHYYYTSFSVNAPANPLIKLITKYLGSFLEYAYILFKPADIILTNNRSFFRIFGYSLLSKIKNAKLIVTLVEDNDLVPMSASRLGKFDNALFNKYTWKLANGALPISDYLKHKIAQKNSALPQLVLPVLVDLKTIDSVGDIELGMQHPFFLFCGSAFYYEVVQFIIDSYAAANPKSHLVLIINGPKAAIERIESHIAEKGLKEKINIIQRLPYDKLIAYYKAAYGLLIPLRDSDQDKARFPHKIGEYCASKNAILSSNWGEIGRYFTHAENALLMDKYSINAFGGLMISLESDNTKRNQLAEAAYKIAKTAFDYKIYSTRLVTFFNSLKE